MSGEGTGLTTPEPDIAGGLSFASCRDLQGARGRGIVKNIVKMICNNRDMSRLFLVLLVPAEGLEPPTP